MGWFGVGGDLMGWGYGHNADGREIGYLVSGECDFEGCHAAIDRGLAFVCGGMHDGGEHGCGRYFCAAHLFHGFRGEDEEMSPQLCAECLKVWEAGNER
jgi:hypothetical protein